MLIKMCRCEHPDTLHVVNPDDPGDMGLAKGTGVCYEAKCDCTEFRELVQLAQIAVAQVTRNQKNDGYHLFALDTQGRCWVYMPGDWAWDLHDPPFQFPPKEGQL